MTSDSFPTNGHLKDYLNEVVYVLHVQIKRVLSSRFPKMQTYAAIDIGSNSCRLKIARVQQHQLKVLHEDREVTRLGASVFESGVVSPEAMASTLVALKRFYRTVKMHSADRVRAVATSALRDARNAQAFLAWVKSETGWEVEIISGLEEARLIHRGVMGEPGTQGKCLLVDVGGGSCSRAFRTEAPPGNGELAFRRGSLNQGFPSRRSPDGRRTGTDEAVYRARAAQGGETSWRFASFAGDCRVGNCGRLDAGQPGDAQDLREKRAN